MNLPARSIQADPTLTTDRSLNLFGIAQFAKGPRKKVMFETERRTHVVLDMWYERDRNWLGSVAYLRLLRVQGGT